MIGDRHPVYEQILAELAAGELTVLERKVFDAVRKCYPSNRTRRWLIFDCYGYLPDETQDLNNNKRDRKIRAAIGSLFDKGIPIVGSSREGGYRIDISETILRKIIAECRSRREALLNKERSAEKLISRIRQLGQEAIPFEIPNQPTKVTQPALFE